MDWINDVKLHYQKQWGRFIEHRFDKGPTHELPRDFCVLEFSPSDERNMWTYATCGMSQNLEIHIFSPERNSFLIELLTVIAHYHNTGAELGLGHTVNFGMPLHENSLCEYGLLSLPYLDGPTLEWLNTSDNDIRFLWLIPITENELSYKKQHGLEALEELFENEEFNYLDYFRQSVVPKTLKIGGGGAPMAPSVCLPVSCRVGDTCVVDDFGIRVYRALFNYLHDRRGRRRSHDLVVPMTLNFGIRV